jgi:hypothetical protein
MKHKQSLGTRPVHQTVAGEFEIKTSGKSIAIGFTDQRLSPHAVSVTGCFQLPTNIQRE